ncbi:MAG: lipopolysaccharide kinase InaA family protein [Candidatus Accumulibacter sp. UW20]|jgi:tRNA A-37 threonylcarbamoyl transferase component Bud32
MMTAATLTDARRLQAVGRHPALPFCVALADGRRLTMLRLLRLLPGKRLVGEADFAGRRVLAKLFVGKRGEKHGQQERSGLEALLLAGVATPELVAAMPMVGGGYAVLTAFLDQAESVADAWARVAGGAPGDGEALALLEPVLQVVGRLHASGLLQEDLHLGNFLLQAGRLWVIDGDALRVIGRRQPLAAAPATANLAVLLAQLPAAWDEETAALLPAYAAGSGAAWPPLAALRETVKQVRACRLQDILAKSVRDCTRFAVEHTFTRFSAVLREEARRLAGVLGDPDGFIDRGCVLKDGGTCTVARAIVGDQPLLIKRYNLKNRGHALGRAWRPSRAAHSWREAHRLQFLGIPTPAPLALIEERLGPLRRRAWLISEFCPGDDLASHLAATREPPADEAAAILDLFAAMHRARISHGDLKATNLLWHAGQVSLIDLDTVVQHRSPTAHARAWRRDRARLLRNWPEASILRRWLDEHLPAG